MKSFHKAFNVVGTMTCRSSSRMACKFCNSLCEDKFCQTCGYPLKLSTSCTSTVAPEVLINFAKQWHTGELSALFEVQGGRILHRNLLRLTQELKEILADSKALARGPTHRDTIENHLKALEYLHVQI